SDTGGSGTLRATIAAAASGDTIDLGTLPALCGGGTSKALITLANGEIPIAQSNLTLQGPTADRGSVTVSANNKSPVFHHNGSRKVTMTNLTIQNGYYSSPTAAGIEGGCIRSNGNVTLVRSTVTQCALMTSVARYASGGGIYTIGTTTLQSSVVSSNFVRST